MFEKKLYAIALIEEGDEYVEESIVDNKYFLSKTEAEKYFEKQCSWIVEEGFNKSDYEIIEITKTILRLGKII